MKNLENIEELKKLISQEKILLVQFGTDNCAPCYSIKNKIDNWEFSDKIKSIYVSIEKFPKITAQENIFTAPTIEVFIERKLSIRKSGYFSLDEIFQQILRYLELFENN